MELSKDFQIFYDLINPKTKKQVEIITPEILQQDFLLHIDVKTPNAFIPQMPRRASSKEDNTIPRVTVSPSLLGCIIGYAKLEYDFFNNVKNGCYINKILFEYALKPTTNLVYDADITDEVWLVSYNKQTFKYKPITIGQLFINNITYKKSKKDSTRFDIIADIYIAIEEDNKLLFKSNSNIYFDKNKYMTKGFYKVTLNMGNWEENEMKVNKITQSQYMEAKELSAALLAYNDDDKPTYSRW